MKTDVQELLFAARADFRAWLRANSETSGGVWLVFGKTKAVVTLFANDALEEALCFGWIDGQMRSVDNAKYHKYFAKRRPKSNWSEKNKKIVAVLRDKGIMTELGEAVARAKKNGTWDAPKNAPLTEAEVKAFADKLLGLSPVPFVCAVPAGFALGVVLVCVAIRAKCASSVFVRHAKRPAIKTDLFALICVI